MSIKRFFLILMIFTAICMPLWSQAEVKGYAGPGWLILYEDDTARMLSLAPVLFNISENMLFGGLLAYEESSTESPGIFHAGLRSEWIIPELSTGFYSTNLGFSLTGGMDGQAKDGYSLLAIVDLQGNFRLFPSTQLYGGAAFGLKIEPEKVQPVAGLEFGLKEGNEEDEKSLIHLPTWMAGIGGFWQGLWLTAAGEQVFMDGGGTFLELKNGFGFGITGQVLREKKAYDSYRLAIMLNGLFAEYNYRPFDFISITPRITSGLALYGWVDSNDQVDGAPMFFARGDLLVFLKILSFLEVGGGAGYHAVLGKNEITPALGNLSSLSLTLMFRVGERN